MTTEILIHATGEKLTFNNGREACEELAKKGIIAYLPERYNPDMLLNKPQREKIISVTRGEGKEETPQEVQEIKKETSKEAAALEALKTLIGGGVDLEQVRKIVKEEVAKQEPKRIEVIIQDLPPIQGNELDHPEYITLLRFAALRINTFLSGPAGTGKTTAARQVAEALNLPFYYKGMSQQMSTTEIFGYMNGHGNYVETDFYKAYKDGGVFLVDEIDAINSNTLVSLNGLLDAPLGAFPCGMIPKHKDFICISSANTIGRGANLQYVGRAALDASSMDRFKVIFWDYNKKLENAISPELSKKADELRERAEKQGMKIVISTRFVKDGSIMLSGGFSLEEVVKYQLSNKLTQQEREALGV
jgi:MoxR-like ATPase